MPAHVVIGPLRTCAAALAGFTLVLFSCSVSEQPSDPSDAGVRPTTTAATTSVAPIEEPSWSPSSTPIDGVLATAAGYRLEVHFVGGVDEGPGGCRRLYRATAAESDGAVEVELLEQFVSGPDGVGCIDLGQMQHADVDLVSPLGDRRVVGPGGTDVFFVDADSLPQPSFMPDGYALSRIDPDDSSWVQSWRPTGVPSSPCTPATNAVDVIRAEAGQLDIPSLTANLVRSGEFAGTRGVASKWANGEGDTTLIIWEAPTEAVAIRQVPLCGGDRPLDDATMVRVALGL